MVWVGFAMDKKKKKVGDPRTDQQLSIMEWHKI